MSTEPADLVKQPDGPRRPRRALRTGATVVAVLLLIYLFVAYVVAPFAWGRYEKRHPALDDVPGITETGSGIPGDPLNVGLIGPEAGLQKAMKAAGWYPADPLSIRSDVEIAEATVLDRPYDEAPVSSLYLWGRKEDLAFEQPVGDNPRKRHHVRFWKSAKLDDRGRPLWIGSVTFDERVGLSDTTGQVTHHIAPDVDAERDRLFAELEKTGEVAEVTKVTDFHKVRSGKNGGGDPWRTDGALYVGVVESPRDTARRR
jgi:hypothetical protein